MQINQDMCDVLQPYSEMIDFNAKQRRVLRQVYVHGLSIWLYIIKFENLFDQRSKQQKQL
jgi:hypothetical protein